MDMNDFTSNAPITDAPPASTVIDTETTTGPSGGGAPRTLGADEDKSPSLRDTISSVVKEEAEERETAASDEKKPSPPETEKAKGEEKTAEKTDGEDDKPKAPVKDEKGRFSSQKPKSDDGSQDQVERRAPDSDANGDRNDGRDPVYSKAPDKFLPDAKEVWRNVPRAVRRDIEIMSRTHAEEMERSREAVERYEPIRRYDELARQNGRDLNYSLERLVAIETALQSNPVAALDMVLQEAGPRKPNGEPVSLFEVAQFIMSKGQQGYADMVAQHRQSQPTQADIRAQQLEAQLAQSQQQLLAVQVIEPFAREHPRYKELEGAIAQILGSDIVPNNLSPVERLEAAYVIAERLNPSSNDPAPETPDPEPADRAAPSFSGSKSIKSAPGSVTDDMEPERGGSIRDILRDEARRMRRA